MGKDAAARIQSAAARNPSSASAQTGFDRRAQSAADKGAHPDAGEHRTGEDED